MTRCHFEEAGKFKVNSFLQGAAFKHNVINFMLHRSVLCKWIYISDFNICASRGRGQTVMRPSVVTVSCALYHA